MLRRWSKLEKDFRMKNGRYNISKIPDIYDCIKYDVQHNSSLKLDHMMEIYQRSKALADIVIPQVGLWGAIFWGFLLEISESDDFIDGFTFILATMSMSKNPHAPFSY